MCERCAALEAQAERLARAALALIIEKDRLDAQALDCPMPEENLWAALRAAATAIGR